MHDAQRNVRKITVVFRSFNLQNGFLNGNQNQIYLHSPIGSISVDKTEIWVYTYSVKCIARVNRAASHIYIAAGLALAADVSRYQKLTARITRHI